MVGEGSAGRESVAKSKALLEVLNIVVLSVGSSREIITAHDEVVEAVNITALVWIVVISSIAIRATWHGCGNWVAHISRAGGSTG
jgi:hypothetical protein